MYSNLLPIPCQLYFSYEGSKVCICINQSMVFTMKAHNTIETFDMRGKKVQVATYLWYGLEIKYLTITVDVFTNLSLSTHSLPRFCLCLLIHIILSRKSLMKQLSYMSHSVQGATFVWHGECKPVIYPDSRKELLIDAYCNTEAPSYPMLLHTICH